MQGKGGAGDLSGPARGPVEIVEFIAPNIWIESDLFGSRHVVVQYHGMEPFTYASFHYTYPYTDNAGTLQAAVHTARSMGANHPIEMRVCKTDLDLQTQQGLASRYPGLLSEDPDAQLLRQWLSSGSTTPIDRDALGRLLKNLESMQKAVN